MREAQSLKTTSREGRRQKEELTMGSTRREMCENRKSQEGKERADRAQARVEVRTERAHIWRRVIGEQGKRCGTWRYPSGLVVSQKEGRYRRRDSGCTTHSGSEVRKKETQTS